ncbi:hypothetical protein [Rhodococcus xishaensis]|uniref:Uncharacterized protein n=1 Tax=Rhodococcus xishaensis TaxID=2487364 RepID=A0A3S3BJA1_9NOCA|nr:hypothetical protein [Rhodococcus xishaensis]RVW02664.1 hypothetical protein EGT50_07765 [Rhodococcus xishaensis]
MKRSGFVVAGVLLAVGLGGVATPTATALGSNTSSEERPYSDEFRLPWEPATPTTTPVLSPFGTADIYCWYAGGFTGVYQLDPWGNKHRLASGMGYLGSAAASVSSVPLLALLPLPFYVWDLTTL